MTAYARRSLLSPPVIRCFEFTRLQNQSIALAYQALIPVISRHREERPRSRYMENDQATTTTQGLRSKARGA
jgi:hypothetical protein